MDDPFEMVAPTSGTKDQNRRTRINPQLPEDLKGWLRRTAAVHANLCGVVRRFGTPSRAGGGANDPDDYQARLMRGDRTILLDGVANAIDALEDIRHAILARMDAAEPTRAEPGTAAKVQTMRERAERGESIFIDADRPIDIT